MGAPMKCAWAKESRATQSTERKRLFPEKGTEVVVHPLLPGIRNLSGEKIQWYLASELRDRIKHTGVTIQVIDRQARTRHTVVPREFSGRLLHRLPSVQSEFGEVYLELYLDDAKPENHAGLYRHGTRVVEDIASWILSSMLRGRPGACRESSTLPS